MTFPDAQLDQLAVDVIRGLSMDMPEAAKCGHPGTAMALAPLAHVLFSRVMNYDASLPEWPDRDRFVLSCGHASVLLYSMLHLTGMGAESGEALALDDLKQFRKFGSRTPGHPERGHSPGIEVTTGPLGAGVSNGVGMGLAERWLRSRFGENLTDHYTYVLCSDGDLMEGISHEAASLAGHLGLGRLIYVYDDNHISIDGVTELSLSDDAGMRFESYGWHVDRVGEIANDLDALEAALNRAKAVTDKPSLIILRSHIGFPAPKKTDTSSAHGEPLGAAEVTATKAIMGLPDESFHVPESIREAYFATGRSGVDLRRAWEARYAAYDGGGVEADEAAFTAAMNHSGMPGWASHLPTFETGTKVATRKASGSVLAALADVVPGLVGGGADLTGNTGTKLAGDHNSAEHPEARQVYFGVREHGMGGIMNGMAAHGGVIPFGGTFFVFADYMRGSIRLAALSGLKVIYSFTHDSVGLGEDGPTHQPIEHLASLRAMPGLSVVRPADANETAVAWHVALEHDGPTALILSRQDLPVLAETAALAAVGVPRGAYVLHDPVDADVTLLGTGSEVAVCLAAVPILESQGIAARVVSMPSWNLFVDESPAYQQIVLPADIPCVAVEAGSSFGWDRWADAVVAIDHFGASGQADTLFHEFGISPEHVAAVAASVVDEWFDDEDDDSDSAYESDDSEG